MRLRKVKNAKEKLLSFSGLVVFNPEDYKGKWDNKFQNNNPIYLEIGMGKGKFILENALKNPDINYIGCELSESILLKAARQIAEFNLKNLLLLNINANQLLNIFNPSEIDKIFLNFSDPWPKGRHEKRRLTANSFLDIYQQILSDCGGIELKTDNRNLFEFSVMKFNEYQFKFKDLNLNLHEQPSPDVITTEYEERFKNLGNIIYYIKVEK